MRLHFRDDEEIARGASLNSGIAFSRNAHARTGVNTGRNPHVQGFGGIEWSPCRGIWGRAGAACRSPRIAGKSSQSAWRRPASLVLPVPPQFAQVTAGPGIVPVPWQVLQASSRATVTRTCAPRMASQKPKCIRYSMSEPFSGSSLAASRSPREKIWEKMSRKPPPNPPVRLPASPPDRPCWKSQNRKSPRRVGANCGAGRTRAGTVTAGGKVVRIESVLVVNLALLSRRSGFRRLPRVA